MKTLLFALTVLFTFNQAQATSLHPDTHKNIRLSYTYGPIMSLHHLPVGADQKTIYVYANGTVVKYGGNGSTAKEESKVTTLFKFSKAQMIRIENLISAASLGEIVSPTVVCLAIPTRTADYRADGFKVTLLTGSFPCGGTRVNQSVAAKKLVQLLNNIQGFSEGNEVRNLFE